MTGLVYKELPIGDITHIERTEFINGTEKKFYSTLLQSMTQYGMRDPVYINQLENGTLKVTVGNNRMVIAKKLGVEKIPCVIRLHDPNNNDIEGRPLKTEQEIIDLFYHKEGLNIKKKDGIIFEVMPQNIQKHGKI
tara:strand:+ start:288 stop:695 length:408 start_codon:yes stop_codon:yes gene_type:complete